MITWIGKCRSHQVACHAATDWYPLQNLARNPGHYSWVGSLGANVVSVALQA